MSNQLELTPAELELIQNKREQEALKQKEAELKKQAEREKAIESAEAHIAKAQREDQNQIAAARKFLLGFNDAAYSIEIHTRQDLKKCSDYVAGTHVAYWQKEFDRQRATIVKGDYKINVSEHITYSGRWVSRPTNHGYKMYLSGPGIDYKSERRAYTNAKTLMKKINEAIEAIEAKQRAVQRQKSAIEQTVDRLMKEYPTATVVPSKEYERSYARRQEYIPYDAVRITFANGINILYKVYPDGTLGRKSIGFGALDKDQWALMAQMSQIEVPAPELA